MRCPGCRLRSGQYSKPDGITVDSSQAEGAVSGEGNQADGHLRDGPAMVATRQPAVPADSISSAYHGVSNQPHAEELAEANAAFLQAYPHEGPTPSIQHTYVVMPSVEWAY